MVIRESESRPAASQQKYRLEVLQFKRFNKSVKSKGIKKKNLGTFVL